MSCTKYEPLLAGRLFGDLSSDEQNRLDAHLQSCAICREQFAELQKVVAVMDKPARPEMPHHFWDGYWHRLAARMEKEPAPAPSSGEKLREIFSMKWSWGWQVATAAVLLVMGIMIGQNFSKRDAARKDIALEIADTVPAPALPPAHNVNVRTAQLLDRSKILLIGIVNDDLDEASSSDLSRQRKVSRSLLQETRALQASMSSSPDRRLQQLLQQLELVLVQITNLEVEHDLSGVDLVREGIDREGLLLKINIEELSRATQKQAPAGQSHKEML